MSFRYTHLLIPTSRTYRAAASQISRFLVDVVRLGFLPPDVELELPAGESWERVPFRASSAATDIERAIEGRTTFGVAVAATGTPAKAPVPIGVFEGEWRPFEEPYYVRIGCSVRPSPAWTSDDQEDVNTNPDAPFFGDPCSDEDRPGRYTHPETLEVIQVPHAGCASFWVEVEFGKSLFPPIEDTLDLAAAELVALAERNLSTRLRHPLTEFTEVPEWRRLG